MFSKIDQDLQILESNLKKLIGAKNPILYAAAEHLFVAGGKRMRPAIVLLVGKATNLSGDLKNEHKRLAEITEIIHTASLLHDDVIDECNMRRGIKTVHSTFSTKTAVLAGDFLFAQSSWYLANLENVEVVKTISKVITDFAEGEVRQGTTNFDTSISINEYIEKSFYKTASLIASSCKASAIISHCDSFTQNVFYNYGKYIGLAFQIIDDILDITGADHTLGKPAGADLRNGNLTAPLLFALNDCNELQDFINKEFEDGYNMSKAIDIIKSTQGIQKAKDLANEHIQASIEQLKYIKSNDYVETLKLISNSVLHRIN